ncbi:uncharacterized protein LOC100904487 [Galendromus occidentalis]|uniref:Uncharacterized protein LOC100904487 n=1 Tax=Galendromus occidentalis TaxID=34638 RepID=A0AAJ6QYY9_9ACAR|nr:uncharacterized protein LOC100904487 [Galendromus occidentalis]
MPVRGAHVALICSWIFGQCSALRWESDNVIKCDAINQYASEDCSVKILNLRSRALGKGFDCSWLPACSEDFTTPDGSQQCFRIVSSGVEYLVKITNDSQYDIFLRKDYVKLVFSDRFIDHPEFPLTYHIDLCLPSFTAYL